MHSAACGCIPSTERTPFPAPYLSPTLPVLQDVLCDSFWQGCSRTSVRWSEHSKFSLQNCPAGKGNDGGALLFLHSPHRQGTRLLSETCPTTHIVFSPETKSLNDSSKPIQVFSGTPESRQHIS